MESCYDLATVIKKELEQLPPVTAECSIYRVSKRLLNIHPTAYEPQVLSIGPFHHGRENLKAMEQFKLQFLKSYMSRKDGLRIEDVVRHAVNWEKKARNCYEDLAINMKSDDFVKMMLVDGCFIVEILVAAVYGQFLPSQYRLSRLIIKATSINIYPDLIMLENQIPFFVLQGLFNFISPNNNFSFIDIIHKFLTDISIKPCDIPQNISFENVNHLIDFLSFYYAPSNIWRSKSSKSENKSLFLPPATTELNDAGVILEKAPIGTNIMDITFENGVLKIPPFEIHDLFEISMRNLMAFENFKVENNTRRYVIHYVLFLGALISSEKDSRLLVKKGIITNLIGGSDEEVSNIFNDIGKDVAIQGDFFYKDISIELHEHCKTRWNRWMASLKRDYFNTPWASVSFAAATLLILLTILQTILSLYRLKAYKMH